MKKRQYRNKRRLRLIPLILGLYGGFLGLGLVAIGFSERGEAVGIIRLLVGLAMACFGIYGIWDGLRDLVRPEKQQEQHPLTQYILTDSSGNRSSHISTERLQELLAALEENGGGFHIQPLPPLDLSKRGALVQISCMAGQPITLMAFFRKPEGGWQLCTKSVPPDAAKAWLQQLVSASPEFSGWEMTEDIAASQEAETKEDQVFGNRVLQSQRGVYTVWHQLLVIFGESWHDEHKFFSARDVQLAVDGVSDGKYQKAVLEWGRDTFYLLPGVQNQLMVVWCTNQTEKGEAAFLRREGTATQVNFWLVNYIEHGYMESTGGWADITAQVEKELKKGERKHGKLF